MEDEVDISLEVVVAAIVADAGGELRVKAEAFSGLTDDLVLVMEADLITEEVIIRLARESDLGS